MALVLGEPLAVELRPPHVAHPQLLHLPGLGGPEPDLGWIAGREAGHLARDLLAGREKAADVVAEPSLRDRRVDQGDHGDGDGHGADDADQIAGEVGERIDLALGQVDQLENPDPAIMAVMLVAGLALLTK